MLQAGGEAFQNGTACIKSPRRDRERAFPETPSGLVHQKLGVQNRSLPQKATLLAVLKNVRKGGT